MMGQEAVFDLVNCRAKRKRPGGFTLVEFLTTVAVLIVVLGLMVSLSKYVQAQSADQLTKDLLRKLDVVTQRYVKQYGFFPKGKTLTNPIGITPLIDPDPQGDAAGAALEADERLIQSNARKNNADVIRLLRSIEGAVPAGEFADLPISIYDQRTLRDAWGTPIVYMPAMHEAIGNAGENYFFVSAGPDGKFLTRYDNLYSYELVSNRP